MYSNVSKTFTFLVAYLICICKGFIAKKKLCAQINRAENTDRVCVCVCVCARVCVCVGINIHIELIRK